MNFTYSAYFCFNSQNDTELLFAYIGTSALLTVPLTALVLCVGFQRWRRQGSSSGVTLTSSSDLYTYNMMLMEIFCLVGTGCYCCGLYMMDVRLAKSGIYVLSIVFPGQTVLHNLTSVEHYLAVVHPITYLSLRRTSSVRNILIGCVWSLGGGWVAITYVYFPHVPVVPYFLLYSSSLLFSSFCGVSVLCALAHPGPGDGGGGGGHRADQLKLRAFHTLTVITLVQVFRFAGLTACIVLYRYMTSDGICFLVITCMFWLTLPSSLVLPLLFLHRAGKLPGFKSNAESK